MERDFIMKSVFSACQVPASASESEEIHEFALHCLREIAVQEYESLQIYFQ